MRKLAFANKWPVCLIALAAACSSPTEGDEAGEGNAANAVAAPEGANAADANGSAPADGNAAATAAEGGDVYRASGAEPFWSLAIDDRMVFDTPDGPDVTVATPAQQPTRAGHRYVTPEMTVVVNSFRRCTAASGQVHHDTVDVTVAGQAYSGCGGAVTAPE